MGGDEWLAIIGGILAALVLRVSNMLIQFLSRVLGVKEPDPIARDQMNNG